MKRSLKENSGITLITLIIIITVIILISGMSIYNVNQAVNSAKLTAFATELRIMQSQVNSLNDKMNNNGEISANGTKYIGEEIKNLGQEIKGTYEAQAIEALTAVGISQAERNNYRYYNESIIKELGIEGVGQELLINVEKRDVVSYKGLEYKGEKYYNLNSLPDTGGIYNVQHEDFEGKPTFNLSVKQTEEEGEWQIQVSNIQYDGYINKWQVKYKLVDEDNWSTSDEMNIDVRKKGNYVVKVVNENIESDEQDCTAEYKIMPVLYDEMQALKFDEEKEERLVEEPTKDEWYSYEITEDDNMVDGGTTEGGNSKWANAKYKDNYFVWIPRYAYKVNKQVIYTNEDGAKSYGIDLEFIETRITNDNVEEEVGEGYTIPEVFSNEGEVAGFWIGKYGIPEEIENTEQVGELQYEAVAILSQSPYGRNGTKIPSEEEEKEETEEILDETEEGMDTANESTDEEQEEKIPDELKTTTGNEYGVYNFQGEGIRVYLKLN